ncbi:MAG TPA: hypothetical protein VGB79_04920, partial [Allosphingosinicella sp.]
MRPQSIVLFERIVLASIGVGLLQALLMASMLGGAGLVMTVAVIIYAIYGVLIYFVARQASSTARWIYVVLAGLGLLYGLVGLGQLFEFPAHLLLLTLVQHGLTAASIYLLFRPDAMAWFERGTPHGGAPGHMHGGWPGHGGAVPPAHGGAMPHVPSAQWPPAPHTPQPHGPQSHPPQPHAPQS